MFVLPFCVAISILFSSSWCIDSPDYDKASKKAWTEFEKYFKDQWMHQTLKYDGPDVKVQLTISDKIFLTSTHVLFNKKHGMTLFIHEFLGTDKKSINYECNAKDNDKDSSSDDGTLFQFDEAVQDKMDKI